MSKSVGIIQSNYIPWKGYFDFIASVDEFVLLDEVQYTRRDWRNRNKIKTADGLRWLTIPVDVSGKYTQSIDQTRIAEPGWAHEHLASLRHAYARAPRAKEQWGWIEGLYETAAALPLLTSVNELFIRAITERLGIATKISRSSEYAGTPGKNERLMAICRQAGATVYLSGPAASSYIDHALWNEQGITVEFKSYQGYPEYPQLHGPFEHGVTILDLFFNLGDEAAAYFRPRTRT
ncbi:MAG TPA: WbqC family protein [Candidatus Acidoferrales bacterium]|nr:WbqC family protein [Candidatus Acidoferrales bacterium]